LATLGFDDIVEHFARHVRACVEAPLLIGHSLGGLVAQVLLDRDLGRGAVALCPAPPRGILPLHVSMLRSVVPQLARRHGRRRIAHLPFVAWQRDFADSMPLQDQRESFARYVVPESGRIWYQLTAALIGGTGGVGFRNRERPPLLLIAADEDRIAPPAMVSANRRAYAAETELRVLTGRGHWVLGEHDADELASVIESFAMPLWEQRRRPTVLPSPTRFSRRVVIIGSGPSGLATGVALKQRGIESVILERDSGVGRSWRGHYDRLRLHTVRSLSALPGMDIPRAWGTWVAAHDFASYLERYARHHGLEVAIETVATALMHEPDGSTWRVETSRGVWRADNVVVATGLNRKPYLPEWVKTAPAGLVIHSSAYRNSQTLRGRDVLVVGAGNSAAEIAVDLADGGAARVRLAVRGGPNIMPRTLLGVPIQIFGVLLGDLPAGAMDIVMHVMRPVLCGDCGRLGLPRPRHGPFTQMVRHAKVPIIDIGLLAALAARKVEVVSAVAAIVGGQVRLVDGTLLTTDRVIAATGYHPGLGALLGAAIELDLAGLPRLSASAEVAGAPGLYCAGYLVSPGGTLRAIARQAERVAESIAAAR